MNNALWVAKTGLEAQDAQMAVTANNIANASTIGFKKSRAEFADLIYQNIRIAGGHNEQKTQNPIGLQIGTGVRIVDTRKNFSQGNPRQTNKTLDLLMEGTGFLQIEMPDGSTAYTRNGSLVRSPDGQLENHSGYPLYPNINIPENAVSIDIAKNGVVSVTYPERTDQENIGQITLARFVNPSGLTPVGDNLYRETVASGEPIVDNPGSEGFGTLLQGALENSNVSVVNELVNMIQIQRIYEMNSNAILTCSRMLQYLTGHLS